MTTDSNLQHNRIYGLDALRAIMMLLGLVVHTVFSFSTTDWGVEWPYKDAYTTPVAEHTYFFIHSFRMPIFFVLAGFFTCMLYLKRGAIGVASNRLQRIGIPLVFSLFLIYPLVTAGFAFSVAAQATSVGEGLLAVFKVPLKELLVPQHTMHLWFLYYLLYFYVAGLFITTISRQLPVSWRETLLRIFKIIVDRPVLRILLPAFGTAVTLIPSQGVFPVSMEFIPAIDNFIPFSIFFAFGWLLYHYREKLLSFKDSAWTHLALGICIYFVSEFWLRPNIPAGEDYINLILARSITIGLVVWLLFYGFTGLFLRYFNKPSARIRYMVDASYWVYLVHLPCAIWLPGLLVNSGLTLWPKMIIVFVTITVVGFITYDLFARSTFIGKTLNGRRYKRGLPAETELTPSSKNAVST